MNNKTFTYLFVAVLIMAGVFVVNNNTADSSGARPTAALGAKGCDSGKCDSDKSKDKKPQDEEQKKG